MADLLHDEEEKFTGAALIEFKHKDSMIDAIQVMDKALFNRKEVSVCKFVPKWSKSNIPPVNNE